MEGSIYYIWPITGRKNQRRHAWSEHICWTSRYACPRDMLALPVVLSSAMAASSASATAQHVDGLTGAMYIFQTKNSCAMFELDTAGYMDWTWKYTPSVQKRIKLLLPQKKSNNIKFDQSILIFIMHNKYHT